MNKKNMLMGLVLMLSVALWSPGVLLAGEHGGSEHGGAKMEGSHEMTEDHAATLNEAARILRQEGHPDLADKLEAIAAEEE